MSQGTTETPSFSEDEQRLAIQQEEIERQNREIQGLKERGAFLRATVNRQMGENNQLREQLEALQALGSENADATS